MPLNRGDIVLVPFDFTSQSGLKWRPSVVISGDSYNTVSPDVMVASITSNLKAIPHPGITRWSTGRALDYGSPSLAQTKLATIESSLIGRKLGSLSAADLAAFDHGLRAALDLS